MYTNNTFRDINLAGEVVGHALRQTVHTTRTTVLLSYSAITLTEIVFCQVHDLLWCSRTFDGQGGHCEYGIASLETLDKVKSLANIFGRKVRSNTRCWVLKCCRKSLNLKTIVHCNKP